MAHSRPPARGGTTGGAASSPACGFVYKSVPHITLKSIAQNTALDPIFAKHEPLLAAAVERCNQALAAALVAAPELRGRLRRKLMEKQQAEGKRAVTDADERRWDLPAGGRWEEWEIPFDTDPDWPAELQAAVTAYRAAWRAKMDEVNACIAANADQEELVDQPKVSRGIVRVSGPFTVEAVQPAELTLDAPTYHEVGFGGEPGEMEGFDTPPQPSPSTGRESGALAEAAAAAADAAPHTRPPVDGGTTGGSVWSVRHVGPASLASSPENVSAFLDRIARLLRLNGVRFLNNTHQSFTRLERIDGDLLHAEGAWESETGERRVAVSIGPEYGPVTAQQVEGALRSANRGGYDDLVFAGFTFDSSSQATIQEYGRDESRPYAGRLRTHLAVISPDTQMEDLLKDRPNESLFTVFGEPRASVERLADGTYRVRMEGVDIYNPVTNEIVSTGADKVAAWFLDTDYDQRSFCICQAFFPDRDAWDKLARALKGTVDEEAFAAFSGTVSLPFSSGEHRRAAVKVIDPRGNEVLKLLDLR
ncbi:MAG: hypothetical protein HYU66_04280 [Armatimonadetes bacterium]|nr:hypothetical protein [Armatimonadota bacterium]